MLPTNYARLCPGITSQHTTVRGDIFWLAFTSYPFIYFLKFKVELYAVPGIILNHSNFISLSNSFTAAIGIFLPLLLLTSHAPCCPSQISHSCNVLQLHVHVQLSNKFHTQRFRSPQAWSNGFIYSSFFLWPVKREHDTPCTCIQRTIQMLILMIILILPSYHPLFIYYTAEGNVCRAKMCRIILNIWIQ